MKPSAEQRAENTASNDNLAQLVASAPMQMTPEHDLWPGIEQKISTPNSAKVLAITPQSHSIWKPLAMAASLCLVAIISWQGLNTANLDNLHSSAKDPSQKSDGHLVAPEQQVALADVINQIALAHQQQISQLESGLQQVSWQANNALNQGLNELRLAAMQTQQALEEQPENQTIWRLWLGLQQRELSLLIQQTQDNRNAQQQHIQGAII